MPNVQFIGEKVCYGKTENYDWSLSYYLFKRQAMLRKLRTGNLENKIRRS